MQANFLEIIFLETMGFGNRTYNKFLFWSSARLTVKKSLLSSISCQQIDIRSISFESCGPEHHYPKVIVMKYCSDWRKREHNEREHNGKRISWLMPFFIREIWGDFILKSFLDKDAQTLSTKSDNGLWKNLIYISIHGS